MRQSATLTGKPAARRRAYKLLALTLILLGLALALPAGASAFISTAATGWFAQGSGSAADLHAVSFPDASHGWAVGNSGGTAFILATANGGTNWSQQDSGIDVTLNSVASSDATHA